ncbi:MAG: D-glycero-beta-D-manno-heptose 1-phosphate adenylyltransferase [Planctomycetia bacterium]|nr:D-glycero-beta-D-manno-heptose 1-phosphate adenylyltransferase [Planctomycetia bacterium]
MTSNDLLHVLEGLGRPRILVLGDLILDRYTWGNAERVSQEAPVIVLRADRREARLGGAANVANMLAGLEAQVTCWGVVGNDAAGAELRQLLADAGVHCESVLQDNQRPTSVKERFIGRANTRHPSQILRVDHEKCDPLGGELEQQFIGKIASRMPHHDALLISDYGKGVCTPRLLKAAIEAAHRAGVPVMVDPSRSCPLGDYRGVTIIKPNRLETEVATGHKIAGADDALAAGRQLCQDLDAQMALITLDRDGMMLVKRDGTGEIFPTHARAVYDITGAGDMVMAMIGLCLASGTTPADAVRLGNVAAGLEVERAGVAVIYRHELRAELLSGRGGGPQKIVNSEQACLLAEEHRRRGEKVVFTNGCFDLLHVGHITYLTEAAALGDVLVVGVNSDASVRKLKGSSRPVIGQSDRAAMLAALACVHYVIVFDDDTPHALLHAIRPDVLVKGGTYTTDEVVGHEIVEAYGGTVCVTGVVDGISTTNILASLAQDATRHSTEAQPKSETNQHLDSADDLLRLRRAG